MAHEIVSIVKNYKIHKAIKINFVYFFRADHDKRELFRNIELVFLFISV